MAHSFLRERLVENDLGSGLKGGPDSGRDSSEHDANGLLATWYQLSIVKNGQSARHCVVHHNRVEAVRFQRFSRSQRMQMMFDLYAEIFEYTGDDSYGSVILAK
jgi:hypothetical protein